MDQNAQFFITVGTVIAVFLWLRNDMNRLDAKIDRVYDALKSDNGQLRTELTSVRESLGFDITSVRTEVGSIRESLGWMRGRMGYSEPDAADKES